MFRRGVHCVRLHGATVIFIFNYMFISELSSVLFCCLNHDFEINYKFVALHIYAS
jgi:hypothetical protein